MHLKHCERKCNIVYCCVLCYRRSIKMPKHESENFYRIITLLVNVCTPILRRVFMNYAQQYAQSVTSGTTPPSFGSSAVYLFLVNHQGALMQLYRKKVIRQEQLTLLTPSSGTSVNLELWDISLLITVLKVDRPLKLILNHSPYKFKFKY